MQENYIKNQFVTYEIALELKELGFDEKCFAQILPNCSIVYPNSETNNQTHERLYINKFSGSHKNKVKAPLWQQIIDWFYYKHGIIICINPHYKQLKKNNYQLESFTFSLINEKLDILGCQSGFAEIFKTREQAILKAIELIKNK